MKEDFLHYIWEFQKWEGSGLKTSEGSDVFVLSPGTHNFSAGPDFFNSQLVIGGQKWAGNVEIHINSSDWFAHHHETDTNYDNVILHVVWNHDSEVFRKDNSPIPVLELKSVVPISAVLKYEYLMKAAPGKWINCEGEFGKFGEFDLQNWLERLYFERLEEKSILIEELLRKSQNDWEEVLFKLLAKNFGLNVNGEAFLSLANSVPFNLVRKLGGSQKDLETLFLGQAGLLDQEFNESYPSSLHRNYLFLAHKYGLEKTGVLPMNFFRLRPDNFPNIRLSQLAALYEARPGLFSEVIYASDKNEVYTLFAVQANEFWETHYTFRKAHKRRRKPVSRNFIDLLIINTLVPLKFSYAKSKGKDISEELLELMQAIRRESNSVTNTFEDLRGKKFEEAWQSQALLHMKKRYCDNNQCLKCRLGVQLLQRE